MGQPVGVVEKPSSMPGIVRFETNRTLTGTGHLRYVDYGQTSGASPGAVVARRLFESGKVDAVHVYGNVVTVTLRPGENTDGLAGRVEELYTYYVEGFVPPPIVMPDEPAPTPVGDGATAGTAVDSRVPAHLLEKSRAALAKWRETHPPA
jgi:hypothetical protein